jgi:hypothetical protein
MWLRFRPILPSGLRLTFSEAADVYRTVWGRDDSDGRCIRQRLSPATAVGDGAKIIARKRTLAP